MRIVLTGGGTAGHVTPFGPIIENLRAQFVAARGQLPKKMDRKTLDLYFLGVVDNASRGFFRNYDVRVVDIPSGKFRRYASGMTVIDLLIRLPVGIVLALVRMWQVMPDVVVSKGGYGSLPVVLAAVFYRIPILIHESDAVIGLANAKMVRWARVVALGYESAKEGYGDQENKFFVTGNPVRQEFNRVDMGEARKKFGINDGEKILLVMGGSQGAQQINEALLSVLPQLLQDMTVVHVTGDDNFEKIKTVTDEILAASTRKDFYKVYPFLSDSMPQAMAMADVVVSRAGANSLSELARLKKPALIIPLAGSANDHQRKNAQYFERHGAARVLDPTNVGKSLFRKNVGDLMANESLRAQLSQGMGGLDRSEAAGLIAELAMKLAVGLYPKSVVNNN